MPLITLIAITILSLVWRDGTFSLDRFYDLPLVIAHITITASLFIAYYLIISKVRRTITALQLKSFEQLESQKKLLQLETYQHQKTSTTLYELRTQDPLTNLYNQVYFKELLSNEIARNRRYDSEFSLLIISLDNLIPIMEMYGNEFVNFSIKKISQLIERRLRKSDILTRYDQHNLAIIAPNTGIDASKLFANRLCNDIELSHIAYESVLLDITLSIGVGIPAAIEELTLQNLTSITEQALQLAITQGGNQVVDVYSCKL